MNITDENKPRTIKESMQMLYTSARRELPLNANDWAISSTMMDLWDNGYSKFEDHKAIKDALNNKFTSDIFDFYVKMERDSA